MQQRKVHHRRLAVRSSQGRRISKLPKRYCILGVFGDDCPTVGAAPTARSSAGAAGASGPGSTTAPPPPPQVSTVTTATPTTVVRHGQTRVQTATTVQTITAADTAPPNSPVRFVTATIVAPGAGGQLAQGQVTVTAPAQDQPTEQLQPGTGLAGVLGQPGGRVVTVQMTMLTTIAGSPTAAVTDVPITIAAAPTALQSPAETLYNVPIILTNGTTFTTAIPMNVISSLEAGNVVTQLPGGTLSQLPSPSALAFTGLPGSAPLVAPAVTATAPPVYVTQTPLVTATTSRQADTSGDNGANVGVIAGVVGAVVGLLILAVLCGWWLLRWKKRKELERHRKVMSALYDHQGIYPFADGRHSYGPNSTAYHNAGVSVAGSRPPSTVFSASGGYIRHGENAENWQEERQSDFDRRAIRREDERPPVPRIPSRFLAAPSPTPSSPAVLFPTDASHSPPSPAPPTPQTGLDVGMAMLNRAPTPLSSTNGSRSTNNLLDRPSSPEPPSDSGQSSLGPLMSPRNEGKRITFQDRREEIEHPPRTNRLSRAFEYLRRPTSFLSMGLPDHPDTRQVTRHDPAKLPRAPALVVRSPPAGIVRPAVSHDDVEIIRNPFENERSSLDDTGSDCTATAGDKRPFSSSDDFLDSCLSGYTSSSSSSGAVTAPTSHRGAWPESASKLA